MTELRDEILACLRSDPERAARLATEYGKRATRSGDAERHADALFLRAEADLVRRRYGKAAEGYAAAQAAYARGPRKARLAAALGALQALAMLGEGPRARRGIAAARRLASDPVEAAVVENAIGTALNALGEEAAAEGCFGEALRLLGRRRTRQARVVRGTARHNLAIRLARRGEVGAALREFREAQRLFLALEMPAWSDRARHNLGWALAVAGRAQEAFDELRAVRTAREASGDPRGAAQALVDEAELALRLGAWEQAADQASTAARRLPPLAAGRARLLAARAHAAAGKRASSRRLAEKARELFRTAGDRAGQASADVLLGSDLARAETTLRRLGHWMGALDALLARRLPHAQLKRRVRQYPLPLRRWLKPELHRQLARGTRAGARIPELRRAFRAAEDLRRLAPTGSMRSAALASHLSIYEEFASALLERGKPRDRREAFLVVDALRARTLREEMEAEAPGLTVPRRVRELRRRLEALWRTLERHDDEPGDLRTAQVRLLEEVARSEGEYVSALSDQDRTAARTASSELPDGPCLALAVLRDRVVAMLSQHGRVSTWDCGALVDLRRELDGFHFQVNRFLHGARDEQAALACIERLRTKILGEASDATLPRQLRVVLPPELGSLPVEALVPEVAVSHLPFACARGPGPRRDGPALLVGIESRQLPAVRFELAGIARQLQNVQVLRGPQARRSAILSRLEGKRIIHLAGHARAREDLALLSALKVKDGWITAADLAEADLDRSLVVLSACRTGDPSLRWQTEGLGGFPRALLASGAAGVIASRWEIPDKVAHAWMQAFYRHFETKSPGLALAHAARDVRERYPHPGAWAAFLHVRNGVKR